MWGVGKVQREWEGDEEDGDGGRESVIGGSVAYLAREDVHRNHRHESAPPPDHPHHHKKLENDRISMGKQ